MDNERLLLPGEPNPLLLPSAGLINAVRSMSVGIKAAEYSEAMKAVFGQMIECYWVLSQRPSRYPLHHFLRTLLLAALFRVRAFLLHLSKGLRHVFDLIPNIKAYVDRGALRSRHRDTIAGPRIDLDDLLLFQFVLRTEDKPCEVRAALELVDDYPFDLCSERSQDVR